MAQHLVAWADAHGLVFAIRRQDQDLDGVAVRRGLGLDEHHGDFDGRRKAPIGASLIVHPSLVGRLYLVGVRVEPEDDEVVIRGLVEGGPAEVSIEKDKAVLSASGPRGARSFKLPKRWSPSGGVRDEGGRYVLDYPGGKTLAVTLRPAEL